MTGPLGEKVRAYYGLLGNGKTAVIEVAASSGLHLVPFSKRNPMKTTTKGFGELFVDALDKGVTHFIIGLGGSATNDGGAGMIQALGGRLLDSDGNDIHLGGEGLSKLATIDLSHLDKRLEHVTMVVACDVDNPLTGPYGASSVYGPQKGANFEMVKQLDENLTHFANVYEALLQKSVRNVPGAGAAGGLGACLLAFFSAKLMKGVEMVLDTVHFEEHVKNADLVITGEGKIDGQTIYGKTPIGVAKVAKKYGIPVIALCGAVSEDSKVVYDHGIDAVFSIVPRLVPLNEALENAAHYLEETAHNLATTLKIGEKWGRNNR